METVSVNVKPNVAAAPLAKPAGNVSADEAMARFLAVMAGRRMELYAEQEEAILELFSGSSVILNTPTGSGKSLVAAALHYRLLCAGQKSVYTCPIKALVNEKFLSLCREFGPDNVGMMTGDATVNAGAPILCCTAEILANQALARGDGVGYRAVIMDEFHYYSDQERGVAWQVPLLTLPGAQFLLMSATLGATEFFERDIARLTGRACVTVRSDRRPVPLAFEYSETLLAEKVGELLSTKKAPIYLVYFTQREASEAAQDLMSLNVCTKEEKAQLTEVLEKARFNSPYGKDMKRWLRHGIGVHHAGLLPKYRILVEELAQKGLLKLICGTDTLGVGINVPIRTVVFTKIWKYDGKKAAILSVRDFKQISGRAGRRGYDDKGFVVIQAPAHVIENKRAEEKAAGDAKKMKKLVKARPAEGEVSWDAKTFERLLNSPSEPLVSRFAVSHGMLLQVLSRNEDGCAVMKKLITDCHEPPVKKKALRRRAWQLFRALLERGIVEWIPPQPSGRKLRVNVELQDDFSLHQALSLFLLDTCPKLDRESADYALDVLTLCESIVEDPDAILRRQVDALKTDKIAEMKAAGVPYEERMEKLEEIEHPKPLREFIYAAFNEFVAAHPWAVGETVRPKSIVRELYDGFYSFADYIRKYALQRSEGLLLRHISQVWKVLVQTVPPSAKTEDVIEMETYLGELLRAVDSSLLEEWERMRNPELIVAEATGEPVRAGKKDITRDAAEFRRMVRMAVFGLLQDVLARDWEAAAERLEAKPEDKLARVLEDGFAEFFEARGRLRLDPEGRAAKHSHWETVREGAEWRVAQVLVDPQELNDWEVALTVSLTRSREEGRVVLGWERMGAVG